MVGIAILGFGTVGSGVAEVLSKHRVHIGEKVHLPLELKYILVRRAFPEGPFRDRMVRDFSLIEGDEEVKIVVETIGGVGDAKEYTERALRAGKSVVTSNKELVATHGYELMKLAQERGVSYLFEASVGGGIPILRPLRQCLAANEIQEICAILNGTTNYILTRMIRGGLSFDAALREAQEKGYAEQDPTADVEGHDACRKICILSSLAFGRHIYPAQVATEGITHVTLADAAYAEGCGKRIKLLGRARREEDGRVCAYVAPHLVSCQSPLAGVEDVFNAIVVKGDATGDVMFYGQGAGKLPTASAVVADVMDVARNMKNSKYLDWGEGGPDAAAPSDALECPWYVRVMDSSAKVRRAFPEAVWLARPGAPAGESAFLTQPMTRAALESRCASLTVASAIRVLE